ncbi:hypothetical protein GOP47_0000131 [Adiantum capillus-veneris]|uniref:Uncharacterized protein n=1 Tax=Adiantum capillus-veneris TaxID=13818 RepID=A0A9D4ZSK7_ADICA|nr:hypothetical protein GOP47_0000131 [Adiantum capillus-veneris]
MAASSAAAPLPQLSPPVWPPTCKHHLSCNNKLPPPRLQLAITSGPLWLALCSPVMLPITPPRPHTLTGGPSRPSPEPPTPVVLLHAFNWRALPSCIPLATPPPHAWLKWLPLPV